MSARRPRVAVVTFPGSCDDRDAAWALRAVGAEPVRVWHAELELDELADACLGDVEAELAQRALDSLALRIEDARLRPDQHGCSHLSTTSGSAR